MDVGSLRSFSNDASNEPTNIQNINLLKSLGQFHLVMVMSLCCNPGPESGRSRQIAGPRVLLRLRVPRIVPEHRLSGHLGKYLALAG